MRGSGMKKDPCKNRVPLLCRAEAGLAILRYDFEDLRADAVLKLRNSGARLPKLDPFRNVALYLAGGVSCLALSSTSRKACPNLASMSGW